MLSLQTIIATKVFPWKSTTWPIQSTWTGDNFTIQGVTTDNFEFQIRKTSELNTNLQSKTSSDVSAIRRGVRVRVLSVVNNKTGATLTYTQLCKILGEFVKTHTDMALTVEGNLLDLYCPSTIIGDLRSRIDGGSLFPGTKITFVTEGATPFVESAGLTIDEAVKMEKHWEQKNVDVEEGMIDFARKYQAMEARRDAATGVNQRQPASDDDEWD